MRFKLYVFNFMEQLYEFLSVTLQFLVIVRMDFDDQRFPIQHGFERPCE